MRAKPLFVVPLLLVASFAVATVPASARPAAHGSYTCAGGTVAPGTYANMKITGVCGMPAGNVVVQGNLDVAPGALLDAVAPGDPADAPLVPAVLTVAGNVSVGSGAVLIMGCSPFVICNQGVTYDSVGGNVSAKGALGVVIHSSSIGGNVDVNGGGGGAAGGAGSGGCFDPSTTPPLWLEDPFLAGSGFPQYTDLEDVTVGGNLRVTNVQTCWLGSLRDFVHGNVTFSNNQTSDPDGMEFLENVIGGNASCMANVPPVQFGDATASPNVIGHHATGQCGFGVTSDNSGISELLAVPAGSLTTYQGTYSATPTGFTVFGTTASGDALVGTTADVTLSGSGLVGSVSEQGLDTIYPDGSSAFTVQDICAACTLGAHSGAAVILATGTTTAAGLTTGTFQVVSGGSGLGDFGTLAGWGTFTSAGQPANTLSITAHLAVT
jgi:hypothetical protein